MANTVYSASLIMTADVSQAKAQLEGLQKSINGLLKNSHNSSPLGLTKEINQALSKVADLKVALESAMNVNTGKLDLSKFSASLKASGTDIQGYAKTLQSLGPAGQQAFSQLAQSIMSAEVPLKQTNKLLNDFKITLANTVKWQISHTMIDSLVGAMQHAYGYAQDLNKSLNNIRIVTGYSTDQMAKFAKEANNAAKALSTTTTQYTDASLIYYQQGLDTKAVKERTDATIKMANVTGESAKAVSDYMTAIWNNFDNGSKSLEYYADVMTALGAATASSTDEIAAGLEKFAAVSETVGLSYEYATAALATVTAETRQNADVVGNAFKTLFSRIQGLNLGETMDDGTTLNKYSTALDKVGISIKDTSGEIKAMDIILDELGSKWDTLSNDTQLALAQTVAGVRQYTQLIALMDNWDKFKINLGVAVDAEGTLQEQADIYAESWQAAADRVKAAFEDIYDSVLNDEFFIKLTDFFGDLLNVIGNTIDGIGGMGGAFAALGVIVSRVWGKDIGKAISSLTYNPTKAQEEATNLREKTNEALKESFGKDTSVIGQARLQAYSAQADVQQSILTKQKLLEESGKNLTEIEKAKAAVMLEQTQLLGQQVIKAAELKTNSENEARQSAASFMVNAYSMLNPQSQQGYKEAQNGLLTLGRNAGYLNNYQSILTNLQNGTYGEGQQAEDVFLNMKKDMQQLIDSGKVKGSTKKTFEKILSSESMDADEALELLGQELDNTAKKAANLQKKIATMLSGNPILDTDTEEEKTRKRNQQQQAQSHAETVTEELFQQGQNVGNADLEHQRAQSGLNINLEENQETIDEFTGNIPETADKFAALAGAISMCALGVTSLIGLFDVWNNQDMSFGEKLLTTFTTLGTVIPIVIGAFNKTNLATMNMAISAVAAKLGMTQLSISAEGAAASLLEVEGAAKMTSAAMLVPLLKVVAVIALVTAAIAGIAIAIDNASYTAEEKLENAKQSAEEFKTSLEEAKNAAQELNSAFDNYNSVVDKLNSCTEGTREYRNALIEANNAALDLLQTYPELYNISGAVEKLDNGLISITEKGQNYLTDQANFRQNALNYANAYNNFEINQLENEKTNRQMNINERYLSRAEVLNDNYSQEKDIYYKEEEEEGRATDSLYQRVRSVVEGIYKDPNFSPETLNKEDFIEAIKNENADITSEMLDMVDIDGITNSMIDLYQAEKELATSIDNNTMQMKLQNENAVDAALGEDAQYKTDIEKSLLGGALQQETDKIKTDILHGKAGEYRGVIQADRTEKLDEELLKKYNTAKGGKYTLDENSLTGGSDNRFVHLLDEAGNQIKVSAETFAETIASYEAMAKLSNGELDIQSTMEALNGLKNTKEDKNIGGSAVQDFIINGDFSSLTAEEAKLINPDEIFEQLKDNPAFEQIWIAAGYNSGEDFIEGMKTDLSNMDFDSIFNNLKMSFDNSSMFRPSTFEGMSYGIQKSVASALDEAFTQAGQDGAESLMEILAIAAGEGEEVLEQVLNLVKNFDWSSGTEEEFANQLYTIMGNASAAGDAINHFGNEMETAGKKIPLDSLDEFISKIHKLIVLLNDLKIGDIVSEDVVNQLAAQGIAIQDYAIKTYEGWKLISQIPTDDLQEKSSGALKLAQGAYNAIDNEKWINENDPTEVDTYTAAQRHLGQGGNIARDSINVLTKDMTPEQRDALFSKIGDSDEISRILSEKGDAKGTVEQYDTMLRAIMNLFTQGKAGNFTDEAINEAEMYEEASSRGLTSMSQMDQFRDESGKITPAGAEALQGFATDNEIYSDALNDYQEALKEAGKGTKAINEATEEFYKRLKKIENTEAAKNIADLQDSMEDMTKGSQEYESAIGQIQTQLEKTFGKEISDEWVRNNQDVIKQWTSGATEAERELAGMEIQNAMAAYEIEIGLNTDNLSAEMTEAMSILDSLGINKQVLIDCVGQGDFSALIGQLTATGAQADQVAAVLSAIGSTTLSPEGFAKIAEALKALQVALQNPTNEDAVDAAIEAFNTEYQMAMSGESPNVPPDMQTHTGGGGGEGSGKSTGDSLQDTIDKRKERRRELLHLKQEGLNPEDASKYYQEEIDLIEEENELLEEQIGMYKEQLPEAVEDFNDLVRSKGFGEFQLVLNDDGTVANLDAVLADLQAKWDYAELMNDTDLQNNLDEIYNALMGPLGIQENIDENVALIAKNEKEQAQLALEDIVNRIDWRIKQIDYQIEKLNYYQEKLLIQAHGNKQTIEAMLEGFQYQEQEMLQLFEKGATLRQGIDELIAAKAQYPDYAQMFDEQILEYQSDLIDVNMDILELRAEMEELVQNVLELALDEMDIQNERIDRYVSMLDRFQNIIDLSGRSILDQSLKVELGVAKLDTLINKMSISKQTMEGLAEATRLAQEALAKRTADDDETSVSFWENQVEMLEIELEKAQDDFLTNWEEVLEAAADIFDMRVKLTVQTLEQALSPFSSLSVLEDRYNKEKDLQEKYLDDATKLYELNKLNRQVNQSISDENDLLAKSKLRDIQEEILAYQKAGVQMSQYDLDILQKKYDLRLAEIALMEAQNSKTSMRLIRDAAGNWTYAYDADQTAIDEALQSVEDATYELQKASTDYIDEMTEEMISIKQEFVEAIGDLDRNSTDYTEQLLYLQQHYMKEYNAVLGEFQKGVENAGLTIHDTWYGATLDLYNFEDAQKHFSDASDLAISELMVNYKDWQKVVEQAMGVAGTSWENFGDDTGATLDSLEEHIQALCDEISKLVDVLMEYVAMSIGMVEEWQSKYSKQVDAELAKNEAYMEMPGHGGNAGSSGSKGIDVSDISDFSSAMTYYIAMNGAKGFNDPYYQALKDARDKKIKEEGLEAVSTDRIDALLKNAASNGAATSSDYLGTDILVINPNTGNTYSSYTEDTVSAAENEKYTGKAEIVINFQLGDLGKYTGQGGRGAGISIATGYKSQPYIPVSIGNKTQSYSLTSNGKSTTTTSATSSGGPGSWDDPRSGWCSAWISDLMHYSGVADYVGGDAKVAVTNHNPSRWDYGDIADGTIVGSYGGKYGHIGIVSGGLIYSTSNTGNTLDAMTPEEYERVYGALYTTSEVSTEAAKNAEYVYKRENGIPTVDIPEQTVVESQNIKTPVVKYNRHNMIPMLYDTGGYTGMWGPQGKWALLHEKELVLNKADTSNILDAVKISRGVDDKISDMIAFTNNSLRDLISYVKLPIFETQPIEQTVQIQAEFPGVTDQYEIQEALSNLSNDASQYLNIQRNFW